MTANRAIQPMDFQIFANCEMNLLPILMRFTKFASAVYRIHQARSIDTKAISSSCFSRAGACHSRDLAEKGQTHGGCRLHSNQTINVLVL
jgi:hypothetical protein